MIEKKALTKAEKYLNRFGYKNLIFQKVKYGINSSSWKVSSENQKFFLKFYIKSNNDKRDRIGAESRFTELLKEGGFKNFPNILLTNENDNWTLFEWLDGEKIVNPNQKDLEELTLFVKKIQILSNLKNSKNIGYASEACFNLVEHKKLVIFRVKEIIKASKGSVKEWFKSQVLESLNKCEIKYQNYFSLSNSNNLIKNKILSPSDIGFHNVLKIKNKLYFHDFEYAGWDDPYKLIVDILIQPENVLSKHNSIKIINSLESCLKIKNYCDYLKVYLILYRAKWVSIIFKRILHNKLSSEEEQTLLVKSTNYFIRVGMIWGL